MMVSHAEARTSTRKDVRLKHPLAQTRWRPLRLSEALIVAWLGLSFYTNVFFREPHAPILYPLWLIATSQHQWIILVGLTGTVIGLHLQAFQRMRRSWVLGSGFLHTVLIAIAVLFSMPMYATTHQQTLATGPHTYQLVHAQYTALSWGWGHQSYIVLECDPTGMICRYDATPYSRYNSCFVSGGRLVLDPSTETLLLRVEGDVINDVYEIGLSEQLWGGGCVKGLSR